MSGQGRVDMKEVVVRWLVKRCAGCVLAHGAYASMLEGAVFVHRRAWMPLCCTCILNLRWVRARDRGDNNGGSVW